jgi:hypothetical protein
MLGRDNKNFGRIQPCHLYIGINQKIATFVIRFPPVIECIV